MCMFSFITVCYNDAKVLQKTMDAIFLIDSNDYEYIVIDGASKDNTTTLLKEYEKKFAGKMRWISEPDNGIYDAMNKGIRLSKGKYLIFINANDVFLRDSLGVVMNFALEAEDDIDIIYGDTVNVYTNGNQIQKVLKRSNPCINIKTLKNGMGVVHQSMFTNRKAFDKIGVFNTDFSIGADWDFLSRAVSSRLKLEYVSCPICEFDVRGVSSKVHNWQRHKIRKKNELYKVIDWTFFKDCFNVKLMIQVLIGQENYHKLRYVFNMKAKKDKE